ncbi:hypothetical protein O6H91_Y146300 [Diphasiastrum complanatum]|nr:hypothetical protein O6H91_Y146300 [Diphasiastrum complanatum]
MGDTKFVSEQYILSPLTIQQHGICTRSFWNNVSTDITLRQTKTRLSIGVCHFCALFDIPYETPDVFGFPILTQNDCNYMVGEQLPFIEKDLLDVSKIQNRVFQVLCYFIVDKIVCSYKSKLKMHWSGIGACIYQEKHPTTNTIAVNRASTIGKLCIIDIVRVAHRDLQQHHHKIATDIDIFVKLPNTFLVYLNTKRAKSKTGMSISIKDLVQV